MIHRRALGQAGLLAALMLVAAPVAAQQSAGVSHVLSFPALNQQYITVRSVFPSEGPEARVEMATWTPGSYLLREFAADVDGLAFTDGQGQSLEFAKVSKNHWRVAAEGASEVVAQYRVHAGDLSVNNSWASPEFVLVNGASVFLFTESSRALPQTVTVELPAGFSHVLAPLPEHSPGVFEAGDFDELVDSPIVISDDIVHRFTDHGHEFRLVNVGAGPFWDGARSALDVQAIVSATNAFWGVVPFERPYWFFNVLAERGGGLEHDHSTMIMGSRWQMREREDYVKWLSLAAHEYFHAWNVRRMRPAALEQYNYETEQYSGSLWFAEGLTSYYDNLLVSRAKLIKPDEYFKRLAIDLHALETTPGRTRISLREASRDAWIRHYRQDANSVNTSISYYTKGAVLGFVLDTRLRKESDGKLSLDEVMREMYRRWAELAYPEDAFTDLLAKMAGEGTREWMARQLDTPSELDIDEALAWYGLVLNRHPVNNAARESGEELMTGFGVTWDEVSPEPVVGSVIAGTSGSRAGLLPGDELIAVDGERITRATLDDRLLRLRPGEQVELLLARRGKILTVSLRMEEAQPKTYEILVNPDFGRKELRRMEAWLGQPLELNLD